MAKIHLVANTFPIYGSMCNRNNKKCKDIFCQYCILYNKIWFVSICLLESVLCLIMWSVYILPSPCEMIANTILQQTLSILLHGHLIDLKQEYGFQWSIVPVKE